MPKITLTSKKFPAINFNLPTIPGVDYGGSFQLYMNHEYDVTQETADAIAKQLEGLSRYVKDFIQLKVVADVTAAVKAAPAPAPPIAIDEPVEIDPDDPNGWIVTELNRLRRASLDQGKELLARIATNEEQFSLEDRLLYLEEVVNDSRQKKGVQAEAEALKGSLTPADTDD